MTDRAAALATVETSRARRSGCHPQECRKPRREPGRTRWGNPQEHRRIQQGIAGDVARAVGVVAGETVDGHEDPGWSNGALSSFTRGSVSARRNFTSDPSRPPASRQTPV